MRHYLKNVFSAYFVLLLASFFSASAQPAAPVLSSPTNGAANLPTSVTLSWNSVSGASSYTLQISSSSAFTSFIANQSSIPGTSQVLSGFSINTTCYWRVNATGTGGTGAWSSVWEFTIPGIPATPVLLAPAPGATISFIKGILTWELRYRRFILYVSRIK